MSETQLIEKPSFDGDITANIKTLGEITSNIAEVKDYAKALNDYYKNIIFTEESIAIAKEEKKKVNKFKTEVSNYRKDIVSKFKEPINQFEQLGKDTESILKDTYDLINDQVKTYEDKQKELKEQEVRDYFNEYKASHNLDFITYEQANINVTLTASMKSLKEQAKAFIDKILDDIQLINLEEHKEEILVEYKQTLNASKSIITVKNRIAMIEREKQIQEELKKEEEDLKDKFSNFPKQEETILQAPKVENIDKSKNEDKTIEEIIDYPFRAVGPKDKVIQVFKYAQSIGVKLIKIKKED